MMFTIIVKLVRDMCSVYVSTRVRILIEKEEKKKSTYQITEVLERQTKWF